MTDKEIIALWKMCDSRETCEGCPEWRSDAFCDVDRYCDPNTLIPKLEALIAENEHLREAAKMVSRWVSVKERLPETEDLVLVTFTGWIGKTEYIGGYLLAEYVSGEGWILDEYPQLENPNVTHWCYLPKPPSTEGGWSE